MDVRGKHRLVASWTHPDQDQTCNPGVWHDWESNPRPFGLEGDTQPAEPHQPQLL